ncbi:MAG: helix-turn-helix transcriptional regulator [Pseudomonadota bacterium]
MDKRDLAFLFADRLRQVVTRRPGGLAGLAREAGIDRSALSEFLAPGATRLPRAEALRRLAEVTGVTTDWLLGLANVDEATRELAPSIEIEAAIAADGETPIARWHREAAGHKIRYVPAALPEQMWLADEAQVPEGAPGAPAPRPADRQPVVLGETDLEIAMPMQALEALHEGSGTWRGVSRGRRRAQLAHIAALTRAHYPVLRLYLFDARATFAAPFTVFGPLRAAVYLGPGYLVMTGAEDVRRLARVFDGLVREAVMGADAVGEWLAHEAETVR